MGLITYYNNGVYPETTTSRIGYGEFVQVATVQKEAFPLAGGLTIVNVQTLAQNQSKPDTRSYLGGFAGGNLKKPEILTNPNVFFMGASYQIATNYDIKDAPDGLLRQVREEFSEAIKKGSTVNATPLIYSASSLWQSVKSRLDYSLGFFRCSLLSLRPQASNTHAEKLALGSSSFSRSRLASISSIISCGKRIPLYVDLPFLCPVAIQFTCEKCFNTVNNTIRNKISEVFKHKVIDVFKQVGLLCLNTLSTGKAQAVHKIAKPGSARTLTGPLTQPLIEVTVMADKQHTQTRPKYQYRFLALNRADRTATPCRLSVEAETEREARQVLVRDFILVLAGRLPVKEISHVA